MPNAPRNASWPTTGLLATSPNLEGSRSGHGIPARAGRSGAAVRMQSSRSRERRRSIRNREDDRVQSRRGGRGRRDARAHQAPRTRPGRVVAHATPGVGRRRSANGRSRHHLARRSDRAEAGAPRLSGMAAQRGEDLTRSRRSRRQVEDRRMLATRGLGRGGGRAEAHPRRRRLRGGVPAAGVRPVRTGLIRTRRSPRSSTR